MRVQRGLGAGRAAVGEAGMSRAKAGRCLHGEGRAPGGLGAACAVLARFYSALLPVGVRGQGGWGELRHCVPRGKLLICLGKYVNGPFRSEGKIPGQRPSPESEPVDGPPGGPLQEELGTGPAGPVGADGPGTWTGWFGVG